MLRRSGAMAFVASEHGTSGNVTSPGPEPGAKNISPDLRDRVLRCISHRPLPGWRLESVPAGRARRAPSLQVGRSLRGARQEAVGADHTPESCTWQSLYPAPARCRAGSAPVLQHT